MGLLIQAPLQRSPAFTGRFDQSIAESTRRDPFESVFPSCLSVIESTAIYPLN